MTKVSAKRFKRRSEVRPYRKVFVIASEGSKTEPSYFPMFDNEYVHIQMAKGSSRESKRSSPINVLQRMIEHLEREPPRKGDRQWLVIDKDKWSDKQLKSLHDWVCQDNARGLALSNPNFEYWLLLHFNDASGVTSARDILEKLKRELPSYSKSLDNASKQKLFTNVKAAIKNAKRKDVPKCEDWPKGYGSTVYRLIEEILKVSSI